MSIMRNHRFGFWAVAVMICALFVQSFSAQHLAMRANVISNWPTVSPVDPIPPQKIDAGSAFDKPEKIYRSQGTKRPPKIVFVPPLRLEWRVLKVRCLAGGQQEEVSPLATFNYNDRLRLAIKANQTGYLYIINETEGDDGRIVYGPKQIFPDSRIMNGQNISMKNQEIILPAACPPVDDPCDCAWKFTETAGRETVIVIFSREQLLELA